MVAGIIPHKRTARKQILSLTNNGKYMLSFLDSHLVKNENQLLAITQIFSKAKEANV